MKKNRKDGPVIPVNRPKKIFMIMKLTFFMTVCLVYGLSANVLSQKKVSMDLGYATIKNVLTKFQQQTGNIVIYSSDKLDTQRKVQARFTDTDVETFLSSILAESGMSYKIMSDYILIVPSESKAAPQVKEQLITGQITDAGGHPLPGVSVVIKGTTIGVASDANGKFTIKVAETPNLVLIFSFIGMEKQEVSYKGQENLKIVMKESAAEMDEVVVTGYQDIKKTRMTGSTETVTSKDIMNKGFTSVDEILKGTMPGVASMNLSGRPGAQAQVVIRGINSLTGDISPIWIVDGMPLQGDLPDIGLGGTEFQNTVLTNGIGNISPDDIESITVLKDAAATALYGSRAANGVIVIKTKRGMSGETRISIQSSYAIEEAPGNKLKMMNSAQKIEFERGIYADFPGLDLGGRVYQLLKKADLGTISRTDAEAEIQKLSETNTNWFDAIFRTGQSHNHNVTLSGGDERTQYYASLNYLSQQGIMPNNNYNRLGASIKLTHDFNKKLRIYFDLMSNLRKDQATASNVNPLEYATYANTYESPYDKNGNYAYDRSYKPGLSTVKDGYRYDFNILQDLNENTAKTNYLSNQANLKAELKLFEGMMYSLQATYSNTSSSTQSSVNPGTYTSKANAWLNSIYNGGEIPDDLNNGSLTESNSRSDSWSIRNQLQYARGFNDEDHYVNLTLGQEVSSTLSNGFTNYMPEYNPIYGTVGFPDLSNVLADKINLSALGSRNENQSRAASFYLSGSYSYKDRYVISASARLDGADIIGEANRFSPLWNISGKWNLQGEKFMQALPFINILAIRASYGYIGSIDHNALPFSVLTSPKTSNRYDGEITYGKYTPGNPDIKWQRKEDRSGGIDLSAFDHRVNITVNYYRNDTRNLLDTRKIAASTGRLSVIANVASLRNSGWEFSLKTVNVRTQDFTWSTSFNISTNKNVVTETYYKDIEEVPQFNSTTSWANQIYVEGESVRSWYGFKFAGIDEGTGHTLVYINKANEDGTPMGTPYKDGKYVVDLEEAGNIADYYFGAREYLGESYPPVTGGFSTSFTYKRLSLSASFTYMTGHKIRSFQQYSSGGPVNGSSGNQLISEVNRWRRPGDVTTVAKYENGKTMNLYELLDFRLEDGNFLKCNNISLGYNFNPKLLNKIGMQNARINFNIQNLFTSSKYRGIDPETLGSFGYPSSKKYNLTLSLGF